MRKRFIAMLLTVSLLLTMFSFGVFADDVEQAEGSDGAAAVTTDDTLTYNGTTMKAYRAWSTVDSRWADLKLGTSSSTVKSSGSLVVALTKIMIQTGLWQDGEADPTNGKTVADLVELLNSQNTFTSSGALYWWRAAQALGLTDKGQLLGTKTEVAQELEQIISWEKQGYHLLICVETTYGSHWLAVDEGMTLGMNDGEVYVMDGDPNTNIDRYPLLTDYTYIKEIHAYTGGTTHAHNLQKKVTAPTCTEMGVTEYYCPDDDEGYYTDFVEALGHSWNAGVTTPATITTAGQTVYTCTRCGETKTEVIPALGNTFVDVQDSSKYYYQPVLWCVEKGIANGTSATTFEPERTCTRAQVITFLYRAAGSPAVTIDNPFTDVKAGSYYYSAVLWGYQKGIVKGLGEHTFSPDVTVTRAQFVTFLYRYAGEPSVSGEIPFADVDADIYYAAAVSWGYQNQIVKGSSQTLFEPANGCTRGQVSTFLYRYLAK